MSTIQDERRTGVRTPSEMSYQSPTSVGNEREVEQSAKVVAGAFSIEGLAAATGVVLTILGLADIYPDMFTHIVVIALGAGLLLKGLGIAARGRDLEMSGRSDALAGGLSVEIAVGAAGIVLGILALLDMVPMTLAAIATIAFGAALMLGGEVTATVARLQPFGGGSKGEEAARLTAQSSIGVAQLTGTAAIVLGILALVGQNPPMLVLIALLAISSVMLLTGLAASTYMATLLRR